VEGRLRDLALFNVAIDSKLRGCDVVALKVDNIAPNGYAADRASVRQKKTGRPVKFELTEATRQAVDDYLKATGKKPGEYLFTGRRKCNCSLTTRQYARLLTEWLASIGLDPHLFGTHHFVEQKRPSSIGARATCEPFSSYWVTRRSTISRVGLCPVA
jgi:integrase